MMNYKKKQNSHTQSSSTALIHALSIRQRIQMIKHFKQTSRRLMYRANNSPTTPCQSFQQGYTLETG